jgi:hypothetical protein
MIKILGLAACVLVALGCGSALACSGAITGSSDRGTVATMTVKSGATCGTPFRGSIGATHGVKILQRPAHGTLQVTSGHGVYYRSRPGYVGADTFSFTRYGLDMQGNPRTALPAIIRVNVVP